MMPEHVIPETGGALPIAPSLQPTLQLAGITNPSWRWPIRAWGIIALAIMLGVLATFAAISLGWLIHKITGLAYHGTWSAASAEPNGWAWGAWTVLVPVGGGLIVGLMARYGSSAIRGHGIPEAMEQILTKESRIPARMVLLKPVSSAIAIGTGGPFGAEGPIIATGGALGSLLGQILHTTAEERKILLAAGAAAGMSATFGTPIAAIFLAIELLLFEFRARSFIPVLFATATAAALRALLIGTEPAFAIAPLGFPSAWSAIGIVIAGVVSGLLAVGFSTVIYRIEDAFHRLPIHWMWWPMIGGLVVGIVGLCDDRALGVGYEHIIDLASGHLALGAVVLLGVWKAIAWSIALGSGTSGGTLAPLFIIGGCGGAVTGYVLDMIAPGISPGPALSALVGMAATFAGASRAVLASLVFACEATRQPAAVVPLMIGCGTAYVIAQALARHSIMTEKIARRGVVVSSDYHADPLAALTVGDVMCALPETIAGNDLLTVAKTHFAQAHSHHAYPVVDTDGHLIGILSQRDVISERSSTTLVSEVMLRDPVVIPANRALPEAIASLRQSPHDRLVVVDPALPQRVVGMFTSADLVRRR